MKDQITSIKKDELNQEIMPARAMAFFHHHLEMPVQAVNLTTNASNAIKCFMLATSTAAFYLWLRINELLNLRPNQITKNKADGCKVFYHEAILRKRKNAHGAIEAQVCKVHPRDSEPAMDMKKYYAKWIIMCEQAIGRKSQDGNYVFPMVDENGNINPKVPMPKDKHKKYLSEWSNVAGIGMTTLGLKGFFASHCFRRGGAQHQLMLTKFCKRLHCS